GALPTAMDFVWPLVRSTTVISFEPSLVTYVVLPSLDVVAQVGCLPTATLRAGLFVAGSNKSSSPGPCTTTMPNAEPRGELTKRGDTPPRSCWTLDRAPGLN